MKRDVRRIITMNAYLKNNIEKINYYWTGLLVVAVALFSIHTVLFYSQQPLLESFAFRQTQTALTSLWIIKEGWRIEYQTPVGGFPWSIPFEFPLFQLLAALISKIGDWNLDAVGRLLSFSFLMFCAWPIFQIARRLELQRKTALTVCALLWSSPLYLFWGRAFMIETAALFFILAAVPYAIDLRKSVLNWKSVVLFMFFASLAILQKVTTAAPTLLVLGFITLHGQINKVSCRNLLKYRCLLLLFAFTLPFIIGVSWTRYSDLIKAENSFGVMLTSKALWGWNFGRIDQRLDFFLMKNLLWDRIFTKNAAGLLGVFIVSFALLTDDSNRRKTIGICLTLFLLPLLIFTNLHLVHDYYPVSSVIFLLAALAVALESLGDSTVGWDRRWLVGIAALSLLPLIDLDVFRYLVFDIVVQHNPYGFIGSFLLLFIGAFFGTGRIRRLFILSISTLTFVALIGPSTYRYIANEKYLLLFTQLGSIVLALTQARLSPADLGSVRRVVLTTMLILTNLFFFGRDYSPKLWLPVDVKLPVSWYIAETIRTNTPEKAGVVTFGMDWSSEVAYYSQRKTFAVPDWFTGYDDVWMNPRKYLGDLELGALVFCPSKKSADIAQVSLQPDVNRKPDLLQVGPCLLWLAKH